MPSLNPMLGRVWFVQLQRIRFLLFELQLFDHIVQRARGGPNQLVLRTRGCFVAAESPRIAPRERLGRPLSRTPMERAKYAQAEGRGSPRARAPARLNAIGLARESTATQTASTRLVCQSQSL